MSMPAMGISFQLGGSEARRLLREQFGIRHWAGIAVRRTLRSVRLRSGRGRRDPGQEQVSLRGHLLLGIPGNEEPGGRLREPCRTRCRGTSPLRCSEASVYPSVIESWLKQLQSFGSPRATMRQCEQVCVIARLTVYSSPQRLACSKISRSISAGKQFTVQSWLR